MIPFLFAFTGLAATGLTALYVVNRYLKSGGDEDGGHWWPEQGQPSPDDSLPDFDLPAEEPGSTLIQDIISPQREAPTKPAHDS